MIDAMILINSVGPLYTANADCFLAVLLKFFGQGLDKGHG
jgi:hypothetical protein